MLNNRVVITGLGIVSPNAIGRSAFFKAVMEGVSGIKLISLFDTAEFEVKLAGEVADFKPQEILAGKSLRNLDRSTKLLSSAAKLGLDDAQLSIDDNNTRDTGVVTGSTLGSLKSIMDFDTDALKDGARFVNPAFFPNTVINSPSSQVSIMFNIKGLNITISTGSTAGLDAINYAADFIRLGRLKFALAAGVEELCLQTFAGFYKSSCVEKKILGEGACVFILEDLDMARSRGANIYAEVKGYSQNFGEGGLSKSQDRALEKSSLSSEDIDVNNYSIELLIGNCFSAMSIFEAAAGIVRLKENGGKNILVSASNYDGRSSSLVISNV
ncbi:MAG: beta-ketoacyl synthase N-terminal-like domain-containing protein [Candidatus Omnitrophota bacterium]